MSQQEKEEEASLLNISQWNFIKTPKKALDRNQLIYPVKNKYEMCYYNSNF